MQFSSEKLSPKTAVKSHNLHHKKIQSSRDGVGPLYHRIYSVKFNAKYPKALKAMAALQTDLNKVCPQIIAVFKKEGGHQSKLKVGDTFTVDILGPWNGPVRVESVNETGFELRTLAGHPEAGRIVFSVLPAGENESIFQIESWARSTNLLMHFFYDVLGLAKFLQKRMWMAYCKKFVECLCRNVKKDQVVVKTYRKEFNPQWQTP